MLLLLLLFCVSVCMQWLKIHVLNFGYFKHVLLQLVH